MTNPTLFVIPADPKNQEAAALTAAATRIALPGNSDVQLLIETERDRNDFPASFFRQLQEDWTKVYVADSRFKAAVYDALTAQGLPVPFYPTLDPKRSRWGYNDTTNSALCIAYIAGCDLVTRMDAGTLPYPMRFRKLIDDFAKLLLAGPLEVTGVTYSKRL
jgi:hypothetical protein